MQFSHLATAEANPFGTGETVREVNSRKTPAEQAAAEAESAAVFADWAAKAAEREAMLDAAPFVRPGEWDEARRAYGHDIRDADGVPVAVVTAYLWREATGLRTLEAQCAGRVVATRDGSAPADGPLVNASARSVEWSFDRLYATGFSATSEWLPAGASAPEHVSESRVEAMWLDLLGDAQDAIQLAQWQAARAAKSEKAAKASNSQPAAARAANPFAALAALKGKK